MAWRGLSRLPRHSLFHIAGTQLRPLRLRPRPLSSYALTVETDDDLDLNQDPVFVHSYPGSRVLELAMPYDANTMSAVDTALHIKDLSGAPRPPKSVGCNVLNGVAATAMQARLEALADNEAVAAVFFTSRSPDVFSSGLFADFATTVRRRWGPPPSPPSLAPLPRPYPSPLSLATLNQPPLSSLP